MIGWLLDTNVVASLMSANGAPSVKAWANVQDEHRLFISVITLAEIDKGIHHLSDDHPARPRYRLALAMLEERFAGRVLSLNDAAVRRWGRVSGTVLRRNGVAPSVVDTLLAATALEHDLHFVTRNVRDVADVGASVFNPWTDDATNFPVAGAPPRR
ncbi:type II toxin-antitoxin system VapC family toxin [Caulobacter mirabilis]|uniref:Ribonuclease VapC n=1 Tax=Caulobacter mirabilis TaxID=69666 RepID=A0A2D2AXG7_9CAUL|nr:type II toxin-antitoxin system VapC family toxin [Caulobacter mirabilis]ATQ42708.1 VapC toxin family PIN domain ribonuclease [Caulobacter mirabilis]